MTAEPCDHKFTFLRTAKKVDGSGSYHSHFVRIDTFFCEKCLEQKTVRKEEYSRETPEWYLGG